MGAAAAAFVNGRGFGQISLSRRPRPARCGCLGTPVDGSGFYRVLNGRRSVLMQAPAPQNSDLAGNASSVDLDATHGFSLQDTPVMDFADLYRNEEVLENGGAYAIRDSANQVCYMGYSKNIFAKLAFHSRLVPEQCASFQVYVPPVPPELISPEMLENVLEYWVRENGGVPHGNTVDRALWEQENPVDRKVDADVGDTAQSKAEEEQVPVRERSTERRASSRPERDAAAYAQETFGDSFRSNTESSGRRREQRRGGSWSAADEDYVEVEVDPLDPFSASKKQRTTRSSWDFQAEDEEQQDDWIPIAALLGCAGFIWLCGILSNALPAATPSLGM